MSSNPIPPDRYIRVRVTIVGKIAVRDGERLLAERDLPGNQGRLVFAMLALEHRHPVSREQLADELWPERLPKSWETALRSVVSKIRTAAGRAGFDPQLIAGAFGCYQLRVPNGEVDFDVAARALHEAKASLANGQAQAAATAAVMTCIVASRPFLPGLYNPWTLRQRDRLRELHVASRQILADVYADLGDWDLSVHHAEAAVDLDPYSERLHQRLIVARARSGDRLGAAHVFSRYRNLIEAELGVEPSRETVALLEQELQQVTG
jgi:DNA-binding SARP family transcriptional activator